MKRIKHLVLISLLAMIPTFALADFDKGDDDFQSGDDNTISDDHKIPSVPEPSGALLMGLALTAVATGAFISRRQRP